MSMSIPSWEELKARKIVQWALAYLAGAFAALELLDILAANFAWPPVITRGAIILLGFGFFVALVVAWYHGEKGRQRVSGPELLMVAGILAVAGAAIAMVGEEPEAANRTVANGTTDLGLPTQPADSIPERSIAVLPLDDHSPDPEDAYLASAMTEEITSALSDVPSLRVTARGSAAQFPESGLTVGEFARNKLGVAHALEGSVQLQDDRARITVQLIDARTEDHVWSETYDVELIDVLDVQVDVARKVADELATTFTREESERILAGATDDPVAQEAYLRATSIRNSSDEEAAERYALLRQAVRSDPNFSLAWAELAVTHFFQGFASGEDRWRDSVWMAFDRAIETSEHPSLEPLFESTRTMMLDEEKEEAISLLTEAVRSFPNDVDLVGNLTTAYWLEGDLAAAIEWNRRTLALDPLNVGRHRRLAGFYALLGLDSAAVEVLRRGMEVAPESTAPWLELVHVSLLGGDLEHAAAAVDTLYARDGEDAVLLEGSVRLWAGDVDGAYRLFREFPENELSRDPWARPIIAYTAFLKGDSARAKRLIEETRESYEAFPGDPVVSWYLLQSAAVTGDGEATVRALDRYVADGGRRAREIESSPVFARVRSNPEFQELLVELEEIVARQRRQVARRLAEEG